MKKLNFLLTSLLTFLFFTICAQEIDIKWSEKVITDNATSGAFVGYAGTNSKYVYGQFESFRGFKRKIKRINMLAFDKTTMKKVSEEVLADKTVSSEFDGLEYVKTIVFEKSIFVFWEKLGGRAKNELYVQSFDSKLKPQKKLKKIYESERYMFVVANKNLDEQILIGTELINEKANKGEIPVKMEYKMMKNDFSFVSSNKVDLPVTLQKVPNERLLVSSYELGDDGNLHVKTHVTMDEEDRKNAKKNELTSFNIFSIINLSNGAIKSFPIKFDNKNIFDFDKKITKDAIKLFGFFCDLKKDPRGNDLHGIFYTVIDPTTFEIKNQSFSYFTKPQLDQLFSNDKKDRSDKAGLFTSKKKKESEKSSLKSNYGIEDVVSLEGNELALFCSIYNNYTRTVCDSKGNCTTYPMCEKKNITVFKLARDGKIIWASNLDREVTYNGWSINDMKVVINKNKFYVIYGNLYMEKDNQKVHSKSKELLNDVMEYAVFDNETGKVDRKNYQVNPKSDPNMSKFDKKYISAQNVDQMDNHLYVYSTKGKIKTGRLIAGLGCIVCFPMGLFFLAPGSYNSHNFFGKVNVMQ